MKQLPESLKLFPNNRRRPSAHPPCKINRPGLFGAGTVQGRSDGGTDLFRPVGRGKRRDTKPAGHSTPDEVRREEVRTDEVEPASAGSGCWRALILSSGFIFPYWQAGPHENGPHRASGSGRSHTLPSSSHSILFHACLETIDA